MAVLDYDDAFYNEAHICLKTIISCPTVAVFVENIPHERFEV